MLCHGHLRWASGPFGSVTWWLAVFPGRGPRCMLSPSGALASPVTGSVPGNHCVFALAFVPDHVECHITVVIRAAGAACLWKS